MKLCLIDIRKKIDLLEQEFYFDTQRRMYDRTEITGI